MGKRRSIRPHLGRDEPDTDEEDAREEEDEDDENLQKEPLQPEEVANIQSRKRLIAKRRTGSDTSSFPSSVFSSSQGENSAPKPSVFSGFAGFGAKPINKSSTEPELLSSATKVISSFNGNTTAPNLNPFGTSNITVSKAAVSMTIGDSSPAKAAKQPAAVAATSVTKTTEMTPFTSAIEETFIKELNSLYERFYGSSKQKTYKIPDLMSSNSSPNSSSSSPTDRVNYDYFLAELNRHCAKWISKHVEENPLVNLTPIFVDYSNYLFLLEKKFFPKSDKSENKPGEILLNGTAAADSSIPNHEAKTTNMSKFGGGDSFSSNPNPNPSEIKPSPFSSASIPTSFPGFTSQIAPFSSSSSTSTSLFNSKPHAAAISSFSEKPLSFSESVTTTVTAAPVSFNQPLKEMNKNSIVTTSTTTFTSQKYFASEPVKSSPPLDIAPVESNTTEKPAAAATTNGLNGFSTLKSSQPATFSSTLFSTTTPQAANTNNTNPSSKPEGLFAFKPFNTETPTIPQVTNNNTVTTTPSLLGSTAPSFKFGAASVKEDSPATPKNDPPAPAATTSSFSFGMGKTPSLLSNSSSIFSKPADSSSAPSPFASNPSPFASGGSTPFSFKPAAGTSIFGGMGLPAASSMFATPVANAAASHEDNDENEPYVPPKPEVNEIKEEGSVYTKRIKVYYYSDADKKFCDRGIGNLHLKPIKNGEKTQLVVRADTNLANIVLNVALSKQMPIMKSSAKDLTFVCVPNPPISGIAENAPCKFLFKVKNEDEANELFDKLNEMKK